MRDALSTLLMIFFVFLIIFMANKCVENRIRKDERSKISANTEKQVKERDTKRQGKAKKQEKRVQKRDKKLEGMSSPDDIAEEIFNSWGK